MKKLILAIALLAGTATVQQANAQVRISLNIGTQPLWGPTGYDYAQYYYMPELGVYYDVQGGNYYYNDRGRWINTPTLPARYGRFNMYNTYKVVLNERTPWMRDQAIRKQYASFGRRHDQGAIRDSRDSRYWENANHPHHSDWEKDHRGGNNNGRPGNNNGRPGGNNNNNNGRPVQTDDRGTRQHR